MACTHSGLRASISQETTPKGTTRTITWYCSCGYEKSEEPEFFPIKKK